MRAMLVVVPVPVTFFVFSNWSIATESSSTYRRGLKHETFRTETLERREDGAWGDGGDRRSGRWNDASAVLSIWSPAVVWMPLRPSFP